MPAVTVAAEDFTVIQGYVGPGYGAPTDAGRRARDLMEALEGIHLETTYTAKCLAGMIDAVRLPEYRSGTVLFWNTYSSVDPATHLGTLPRLSATAAIRSTSSSPVPSVVIAPPNATLLLANHP